MNFVPFRPGSLVSFACLLCLSDTTALVCMYVCVWATMASSEVIEVAE
jgi:hypothetical protein